MALMVELSYKIPRTFLKQYITVVLGSDSYLRKC